MGPGPNTSTSSAKAKGGPVGSTTKVESSVMGSLTQASEDGKEVRSAGRSPLVGRLRIGKIVNSRQPTQASIPSKFETVFNTSKREKDGFSRRTQRFVPPENDLPGPGAYLGATSNVSMLPDPAYVNTSLKGTTAFASGSKIRADVPRPLFVTPGPGAYKQKPGEYQPRIVTSPRVISARGSAAFVGKLNKTAAAKVPHPTPGPGDYDVAESMAPPLDDSRSNSPTGKVKLPSAVFRSTTGRSGDQISSRTATPVPTKYADSVLRHKSISKAATMAEERPEFIRNPFDPFHPKPAPPITDPVFRSTTDRFGYGKDKFFGDHRIDPKNIPPVPGVGTSTRPPGSPTHSIDSHSFNRTQPSSMFAATVLDRFGRPTVKFTLTENEVPGPGAYEDPNESMAGKRKLLISSAWAMSGVGRFEGGPIVQCGGKPPGPAYYSPKGLAKKSYHMNQKRVWLGR